jgi:hypothetical protein
VWSGSRQGVPSPLITISIVRPLERRAL